MTRVAGQAIDQIRAAASEGARKAWTKLTGREAESSAQGILEAARSSESASSLAAAWRRKVEEARAATPYRTPGTRPVPIEQRALADIQPAIRRTAQTETVDAWAAETSRQNDRAYALGLDVTEEWIALLDACPRCWALHGQTVTRPDTFPEEPPLHPHCHCYLVTTIATADRRAA